MRSGRTNEVASTSGQPASASRRMKAIFTPVGTATDSFWSPSRGLTSITFTFPEKEDITLLCAAGRLIGRSGRSAGPHHYKYSPHVHHLPRRAAHLRHGPRGRGGNGELELHRLHPEEGLARRDGVPLADHDLEHLAGHRSGDLAAFRQHLRCRAPGLLRAGQLEEVHLSVQPDLQLLSGSDGVKRHHPAARPDLAFAALV